MTAAPVVPSAPGVPSLQGTAGTVVQQILLASDAALNLIGFASSPKWGIYPAGSGSSVSQTGGSLFSAAQSLVSSAQSLVATGALPGSLVPVVTADNCVAMEFKQEWLVSDYPVENGGFASYNKVTAPYTVRVRFSSGGSLNNRENLLNSVKAIAFNAEVYDVVTPEQIYPNMTVTHFDYRRTAKEGVGLIEVDVWLLEVRVPTPTAFYQTIQPSGTAQANAGAVAPGGTYPIIPITTEIL